jgi:hypothetical protein
MKLKYILNPIWWHLNDRYSKRWDIELNRLIDEDNGVINYFMDGVNFFQIQFGEIRVWVEHYPYGYGTPYCNKNMPNNIRPSRKTIERLKEYVDSKLNKY